MELKEETKKHVQQNRFRDGAPTTKGALIERTTTGTTIWGGFLSCKARNLNTNPCCFPMRPLRGIWFLGPTKRVGLEDCASWNKKSITKLRMVVIYE
jgi:hypothetical protein